MPFKTRKKKVSAADRRFTILQNGVFTYTPEKNQTTVELQSKKTDSGSIESYKYVTSDVTRIAITATIIIAAQFFIKFFFKNS